MRNQTRVLLFLGAAIVGSAQTAVKAQVPALVPKDQIMELQLIDSQQSAAVAPFQSLLEQVSTLAAKVKSLAQEVSNTYAERHNALVLDICKTAGISEDQTKAGKCLLDMAAKTVTLAPTETLKSPPK